MLVLEKIFCVMMVVSEGGESSQMTLTRYSVNLHKRTLVYRSLWLSSQYTAIRKTMIISHFGAIKFSSQCSTSHDKNHVFPLNVPKSWGEPCHSCVPVCFPNVYYIALELHIFFLMDYFQFYGLFGFLGQKYTYYPVRNHCLKVAPSQSVE